MKNIFTTVFLFCLTFILHAQVKTPQPSPWSKVEQKVGLTHVTLEYSRPSMKGRTIFGDLVPYGKLWRTGANASTKITFDTSTIIDGQELKAGTYAIYTIPNKDAWEVYLYTDSNLWGAPKTLDPEKIAAKTVVNTEKNAFHLESFTIDFSNLNNAGAEIEILWDNISIFIPFTVPTAVAVQASIDKTMAGTPKAQDYYAAANYYLEINKDMKQAQQWIDKAIEMTKDKPKFWYLRRQALIHAKNGDTKGAIKAAKASIKYAEKAGNDDYVKMNNDSLKEWGA